jgi:hypothetical protein
MNPPPKLASGKGSLPPFPLLVAPAPLLPPLSVIVDPAESLALFAEQATNRVGAHSVEMMQALFTSDHEPIVRLRSGMCDSSPKRLMRFEPRSISSYESIGQESLFHIHDAGPAGPAANQ